jgi:hypothetical protein
MNESAERPVTCEFRIVQDWGYFWIERRFLPQTVWERAPFSFKSEALAKEHLNTEVCAPYVCCTANGYYQTEDMQLNNCTEHTRAINIIFDSPPGPDGCRFVEVETDDGKSINAGQGSERPDGYWSLRITELSMLGEAPDGFTNAEE